MSSDSIVVKDTPEKLLARNAILTQRIMDKAIRVSAYRDIEERRQSHLTKPTVRKIKHANQICNHNSK